MSSLKEELSNRVNDLLYIIEYERRCGVIHITPNIQSISIDVLIKTVKLVLELSEKIDGRMIDTKISQEVNLLEKNG